MIRRAAAVLLVALFSLLFASVVITHTQQQTLRPLAQSYLTMAPQQRASPNVITAILMTFRAFDTLGEVAVLFMAAAGAGLVLTVRGQTRKEPASKSEETRARSSEIVRNGATVLFPLILMFAAYIVMNGHLSAGGGFQGGAVIASALMLLLLARPDQPLNVDLLGVTESLAGVLFVMVGIAGLLFAGGFLDNRVLPLGELGAFFSAGAIPVLSVLLGVKVGCELSVIIDRFRG